MTLNSLLPAWSALVQHADTMGKASLRELVGADSRRLQRLHFESGDWLLDLSRQRLTPDTLDLLFSLARSVDLGEKIKAMFRGDTINGTERRAVLHTALRSTFAGSPAIQAEVAASRAALSGFAGAVRRGELVGAQNKRPKPVTSTVEPHWGR